MKKILLLSIIALIGLTSCDMEETPYNAIPDTEALQNANDFASARVGLYSPLRGVTSGAFAYLQDIQADNFNAVAGFSNTLGDFYTWQVNSQSPDIEGVYGNFELLIGRCNFVIDGFVKADFENVDAFPDGSLVDVETTVGEAYYIRAFGLLNLAQYFCADYNDATADEPNSGVSYSLAYAPSSEVATYPARYTLRETYSQILSDIDEAAKYIKTEGEVSSAYITVDAITALRARVALAMDDYKTAAAQAVALINTGNYDLAYLGSGLNDMWTYGTSSEAIWQLPCPSLDELAGQTGVRFLAYSVGSSPDYVPSGDLINSYDFDRDWRTVMYFAPTEVTSTTGTSGEVELLNKYPDHSYVWNQFQTDDARFVNEPMVFRIAEAYLIAAEAYAQQGDLANAAKYLNLLEKARIEGYTDQSFLSKESAMTEIKVERRRELVCEGTRLFDLKRWGDGVSRTSAQIEGLCLNPGSAITTNLTKSATDPKMIWPIPKTEVDANPQIVQNPGW